MRHSGLLAICTAFTLLGAAGCGGGGGGNSSPAVVNGVWTGASAQTRAVGNRSALQIEFFQSGTTVDGTMVATGSNGSSISILTGTINGNRLTASVKDPQASPAYLFPPRTDSLHGFEMPSSYSTTAPFDLTRPIIVSIDNRQLSPAEYTINSTTLSGNRIYILAAVPRTALVQIQYYPFNENSGAGSTAVFSAIVSGTTMTGTYSVSNTNDTQGGTFTLTHTVGVTTPRIGGLFIGTFTPAGGAPQSLTANFTQNKDSLTFDGPSGNTFTGTGALVGSNVTLIVPGSASTTYFTGLYVGAVISGTTLDSLGKTGVFRLEPAVTILTSHR